MDGSGSHGGTLQVKHMKLTLTFAFLSLLGQKEQWKLVCGKQLFHLYDACFLYGKAAVNY